MTVKAMFLVLGILVLTGCASFESQKAIPSNQSLLQYAEEPVQNIQFSRLIAWDAYNEDYLILRLNNQRWIALSMTEPCGANIYRARNLQLETVASMRLGLFDQVLIDGWNCEISEIRPLDHKALGKSLADQSFLFPPALIE